MALVVRKPIVAFGDGSNRVAAHAHEIYRLTRPPVKITLATRSERLEIRSSYSPNMRELWCLPRLVMPVERPKSIARDVKPSPSRAEICPVQV
jgi:hypothetical protein